MSVPVHERFERHYIVEPNSGCWLWTGATTVRGYGQISSEIRGKPALAHRVSYEKHAGPIPDGMFVCHKCDTPACVNPGHLFLGTVGDNNRDSVAKGRHAYPSAAFFLAKRRGRSGASNHKAKLTDETVSQMRQMHSAGVSASELARRYGVSKVAAGMAIRGKTWRHVA